MGLSQGHVRDDKKQRYARKPPGNNDDAQPHIFRQTEYLSEEKTPLESSRAS